MPKPLAPPTTALAVRVHAHLQGLSVASLAKLAGVAQSTLQSTLTGPHSDRAASLRAVADELGVDAGQLVEAIAHHLDGPEAQLARTLIAVARALAVPVSELLPVPGGAAPAS